MSFTVNALLIASLLVLVLGFGLVRSRTRKNIGFVGIIAGLAGVFGVTAWAGGIGVMADPMYPLLVGAGAAVLCAAAFGGDRIGMSRTADFWLNVWRPALATLVTFLVTYVPVAYWPEIWAGFDRPIFALFVPIGVLVVFWLLVQLVPPAALVWGPVIAAGALVMRYGLTAGSVLPARYSGLFFKSGVVPTADQLKAAASVMDAITAGGIIVVLILPLFVIGQRAHPGRPSVFVRIESNMVYAVKVGTAIGRLIADLSSIPRATRRTPANLVVAAQADPRLWEQVFRHQVYGANGARPAFGELNPGGPWANWDRVYADDAIERLEERLDLDCQVETDLMVLPQVAMIGFVGWAEPWSNAPEPMVPVLRDIHGKELSVPPAYLDLRTDPPVEVRTETIVLEQGLEATIKVTYRQRPVHLRKVLECKGRTKVVKDLVRNGTSQAAQVVGAWMYLVLGRPMADPARGGVQDGLVVQQQPQPATPLTLERTQFAAAPRVGRRLPPLIPAPRPAFLRLRRIFIRMVQEILEETGMYVFDLQIDDVDLPPAIRDAMEYAVKAVIVASKISSTAAVRQAEVQAYVAGAALALNTVTGLDSTEKGKILEGFLKILPVALQKGDNPTNMLLMAGARAGIPLGVRS